MYWDLSYVSEGISVELGQENIAEKENTLFRRRFMFHLHPYYWLSSAYC